MRVRGETVGAALALVLAAGCRGRDGISFDQFVNTTVELRRAANQTSSPAAFEARKRAIEARHHVTDADLERFTRQHAADARFLASAWDSVQARLERATLRDATTRPTSGPPPVVTVTPGTISPGSATPAPAGGAPPPRGRHDF